MKARVLFLFLICSSSTLGFAAAVDDSKPKHDHAKDVLTLRDAITLSYNGEHGEAQKRFLEYVQAHPGDMLVGLRLAYDRFSERRKERGELPQEEYALEIRALDEAIAEYEARGCTEASRDTIRAIAGDTIDCEYLATGFYSLRMTLRGENEGWFSAKQAIEKDHRAFLDVAAHSKSKQAKFLLGLYEYKASEQGGFRKMGVLLARIPRDRSHAVEVIEDALHGNSSPFVDDIYIFILDAERRRRAAKDQSGFEADHPILEIERYLKHRYPRNPRWNSGQ